MALAAAALTLAVPAAFAQSDALPTTTSSGKPLAFAIVSIKRHGNVTRNGKEGCYIDSCHFVDRPLLAFIMVAYNLSQKPIHGDPLAGDSDLFDLDAKIDPADLPTTPLSSRQLAEMLQPVLVDRFQLRVHHEIRILPVYNVILAKGGLKMKKSALPGTCHHTSVGSGLRVELDCTMNDIRNILEDPSGRYVIDKTGLTDRYDFDLHWTPDDTPADSALVGGPSIFTAVQEQLGLKLEPASAPVEVLVIDSAKQPSPN
ncbi:MAG: TIGR03435 family protein [Terracidiphilus sp.]